MKRLTLYILISLTSYTGFAQIDPSEQLVNTTIQIEGEKDSIINGITKRFSSKGTGFFFKFLIGKDTVPTIVTNWHVIRNCHVGFLRFKSFTNGKINYGDHLNIKIADFESRWIKHPTEDLAILPLAPIEQEIFKKYQRGIYAVSLDENYIPSDSILHELLAIEEIDMIGYPKGLSDDVNDLPIVRKGLTATPVYIDYKGTKRFLVDIAIYPGSSGSPICLYNVGSYTDKRGNTYMSSRFLLLGIAVESNNYIAKGSTLATSSIPPLEVNTELPYGIAIAIKSNRLLDFKEILYQLMHKKN